MFRSNIKKLNRDNKIFEINWNKEEKKDPKDSEIIITHKQKIQSQIYTYLKNKSDIQLPAKNSMIRVIVKRIPSQTFIYKITESEIIEEMTIAIFSVSRKIITGITALMDEGKINPKINILVSDMWAKLKKESDYLFLTDNFPSGKIGIERIHVKIMLAKTNLGNYYIYEGSGNLSTNTNYEQYIFEESKDTYDFHYKWINELIDKNIQTQ
jgi:hypothetical protein